MTVHVTKRTITRRSTKGVYHRPECALLARAAKRMNVEVVEVELYDPMLDRLFPCWTCSPPISRSEGKGKEYIE